MDDDIIEASRRQLRGVPLKSPTCDNIIEFNLTMTQANGDVAGEWITILHPDVISALISHTEDKYLRGQFDIAESKGI